VVPESGVVSLVSDRPFWVGQAVLEGATGI
jgi:hypothetical protein